MKWLSLSAIGRERAEMKRQQIVRWLGISASKYYDWCARQGEPNHHNGQVPKENWLEGWEKAAIRQVLPAAPPGRLSAPDLYDAG